MGLSPAVLSIIVLVACLTHSAAARTTIGFLRRAATASDGTRYLEEIYAGDLTPVEDAPQPLHVFHAPDGSLVEQPEALPVHLVAPSSVPLASTATAAADGASSSSTAVELAHSTSVQEAMRGVEPVTEQQKEIERVLQEDDEKSAVRIRRGRSYA